MSSPAEIGVLGAHALQLRLQVRNLLVRDREILLHPVPHRTLERCCRLLVLQTVRPLARVRLRLRC